VITQALANAAYRLRENPNALLHEGKQPSTKQDVEDFVAFTELLLHVTYELPAEIAAREAKNQQH